MNWLAKLTVSRGPKMIGFVGFYSHFLQGDQYHVSYCQANLTFQHRNDCCFWACFCVHGLFFSTTSPRDSGMWRLLSSEETTGLHTSIKKKKKIVTRGNAVTSNMKSWRFPTDLAAFIRVPKKSDAVLRVSWINEIRNKCLKDRHPPVKPVLPQRAPLCRVAFFTNTLFSLPLTLSNS